MQTARTEAASHSRRVGEGVLEVGVQRQVGGVGEGGKVQQHLVEADRAVRLAHGPGHAGAGAGQGLEAEVLQYHRRADVPGIGQDEAAVVVQSSECGALFAGRDTHGVLLQGSRRLTSSPVAGQ